MTAMERFATTDVTPPERRRMWNRIVEEIYSGTQIDFVEDGFSAEIWRWQLGDLAMIRPRSQELTVRRRPVSTTLDDKIILHFQHRGHSRHHQNDRAADLRQGDFSLLCVATPYQLDLSREHEMLIVEFPRAPMIERVANFEDMLCRPIPARSPGGRIFQDFLLSLWRQGDQSLADREWSQGITGIFLDLLALGMRGWQENSYRTSGGKIEQQLFALVEARLSDPDLRSAGLADALNISVRSVQNIFALMGITPTGYILERRLKRSAERLLAAPAESVTEIAFDLGFNDSAYFSRCFRRKFGMAPSQWRARH